MDKPITTFGEALSSIMKEKGMTVVKLCKAMNIKSQTTVSRILKDESSYERTQQFFAALQRINPLELIEHELSEMGKALEVNKNGKELFLAKQEMLRFVQENISVQRFTLASVYGSVKRHMQTLDDLFSTYTGFSSVKVFLLNCVFDGVINALIPYLKSDAIDFSVEQYTKNAEDISVNTQRFMTLLPILNFKRYQCYQAHHSNNGVDILNPFNNMMVVLKITQDGKKTVDVLSLHAGDKFTVLSNQESPDMYDYYTALFGEMKKQHNPIKKTLDSDGLADNLLEVSRYFLGLEETWQQIVIKPSFCFYTIDSDILERLLYPNTLPADKKQLLMDIHHKRFMNYNKGGRMHTGIYSMQGIQQFLETGMFSDHIAIFRPFTRDEVKDALRSLIEISERLPINAIHLLKNDIIYNHYQYLLYGSSILFYCDGTADYEHMNFDYIINSQRTIDVFHDFVMHDLIPKYCYSKKESLEILRGFISSSRYFHKLIGIFDKCNKLQFSPAE